MSSELNNKNPDVSKTVSSKFSDAGSFKTPARNVKESGAKRMFDSFEKTPPRVEKISSNYILGALPDFDAARLIPQLDFVSLAAGAKICTTGEFNRYVYFPETAVASDISDLADGGTIETAMTGREGATGLDAFLGSQPTKHRSQITIGGNAWRIKAEMLKQEFARAGKLQTLLLEYVSRHINQISQRLICKSFHLLENRLCGWLLMLRDRVENNQLILTQENVALLLGANRPSITLAAQTLRHKGLINYSRGGISILDRQGLENSACECYCVLRADNSNFS